MRKLIIALVAATVGIVANAATYNWEAQKGYIYDGAATPAKMTSGTAYLIFASSLTQEALVTAFAADAATAATTVSSKAVSTGTIGANSRIATSDNFTFDTTSDQTAYFVIFNGDNMYVSITANAEYYAVGESAIAFESVSSSSKAMLDASAGYSAAGWYSAVPEPTSGLLLLLGMAGLALKRKRA